MDIRLMGSRLFSTKHQILDESSDKSSNQNAASRTYARDVSAKAATLGDIKDEENGYVFLIDMPGVQSGDISVQVEDENVLLIAGERKRDEEHCAACFGRCYSGINTVILEAKNLCDELAASYQPVL